MDTKTFNLIDSINREGIDNGLWGVYDFTDQPVSSKTYFGTMATIAITGKVLVVYVKDDDTFSFLKPETADMILPLDVDNNLHIWHI